MRTVEENLHRVRRDALTPEESATLWQVIAGRLEERSVPLAVFWLRRAAATGVALAGFILSGTGLAFAADRARPGAVLYPVDRALERMQLALTLSHQAKNFLRVRFARERLSEVEAVLTEAQRAAARVPTSAPVRKPRKKSPPPAAVVQSAISYAEESRARLDADADGHAEKEEINRVIKRLNAIAKTLPPPDVQKDSTDADARGADDNDGADALDVPDAQPDGEDGVAPEGEEEQKTESSDAEAQKKVRPDATPVPPAKPKPTPKAPRRGPRETEQKNRNTTTATTTVPTPTELKPGSRPNAAEEEKKPWEHTEAEGKVKAEEERESQDADGTE